MFMSTKQILIRENDMGWTNGSAIMGEINAFMKTLNQV